MEPQKFTKQFATLYEFAVRLRPVAEAEALLVLLDGPTEWDKLRKLAENEKVIVAADSEEKLAGAKAEGLATVVLHITDTVVVERLAQALLECVAEDILAPNSAVVALYSQFEAGKLDSISFIRLDEHLGRLTARDLRQLKTSVPLETLRTVVDLAVDIGREGREGKPVGTMFVIGDTRKVLSLCREAGFDPVKGYKRQERNINDPRTRESMKEIAQLDGAMVIAPDGTCEKACQILEGEHTNLNMSKGLGARHWAAAAITKATKAIAVVVSESSGSVRLFQGGEVILRIEPFRRAMKWKDFEQDTPAVATERTG